MRTAGMMIGFLVLACPVMADDLPVSISPQAISSSPKIKTQETAGGQTWLIEWRKDRDDRRLLLMGMKAKSGKRATIKRDADDIHEIVFEEGLTEDRDEADVREEADGEMEIWGGEADWLLGSELAERSPYAADINAEIMSGQTPSAKAPRGPMRNYCVSFTWLADNRARALAGAYCRVFPIGEQPTAEGMLESLDLEFK